MKAVKMHGLWALWADEAADFKEWEHQGAYEFLTAPNGQRRFVFVCPGNCKSLTFIAIRPVVDGSPQSWEFDGNEDSPTLTPSINHVGCWHGYLTAGEFVPC